MWGSHWRENWSENAQHQYQCLPVSQCPIVVMFIAVAEAGSHIVKLLNERDFSVKHVIGGKEASKAISRPRFDRPFDVTFFGEEEIIVADTFNHRLEIFNLKTITYLRTIGSQGSGPGQLLNPASLLVNDDEIFIAEGENYRISVFNPEDGKFIRQWGRKGPATEEFEFSYLSYLWMTDGMMQNQLSLFVSDTNNHCVKLMNPLNGQVIQTIKHKELTSPTGIVVVDDHVYVSDYNAKQIFVYNLNGDLIKSIGIGLFSQPHGLALLRNGNLIAADGANNKLLVFR